MIRDAHVKPKNWHIPCGFQDILGRLSKRSLTVLGRGLRNH